MAQYSELGIQGGGSNFLGDVGNYGPHVPTGWFAGGFFRYNFNRYYSVRLGGNYGSVAGDDATSGENWRQIRNLHFRSSIWEAYAQMEFNFFEFEPGTKLNHTPFIFAGLAIFGFNPKAELDGEWVELQPIGTEGQGTVLSGKTPYGRTSLSYPFGMGYKWSVNKTLTLQIECGFRSTRTDYLDDVSGQYVDPGRLEQTNGLTAVRLMDRSENPTDRQGTYRGNPDNNDWYIFTGFGLVWQLTSYKENCNGLW